MFFGWIGKGGQRLVAVLAVSAAALSIACTQAFAEDQDMTVVAQASSGPLRCEIRKNQTGGSVQLIGIIVSSRAIAGNFRFTVTKSGPSGSSHIHQGNRFDLAAGKESQVGLVKINLEHDALGVVELFVGSDDGLECRANVSLQS
jgi:hypothetical protein